MTWLGSHGAIVVYGLRRGELINVVSHYDDATYKHESRITAVDRAEVDRALERLARVARAAVPAAERWYKWALDDRDPIPR